MEKITLMILSMTGFGKNEINLENKVISIEVRTLNSNKGLDLSIKLPNIYREKENEIRNIIGEKIIRGKVDFFICSKL